VDEARVTGIFKPPATKYIGPHERCEGARIKSNAIWTLTEFNEEWTLTEFNLHVRPYAGKKKRNQTQY
jgi:hypothetical protein